MRRSNLSWLQPLIHFAAAMLLGAACLSASLSPAAAAEPEPARLVSLGKCLSTNDAGIDAAPAVLSACTGRRGQQWKLPPRGFSGPIVGAGGKCLDVTGNNPADRTPIIVFSCHGLPNQAWRHELDGRIVGLGGKCLDVLESNTADGTPLILFPCTPTDNQLWRAEQPNQFHSEPLVSGANLVDLAFSASRPGHVFAAAPGHGILRSENGGQDFILAHRGVPAGGGATAVAVDALRPDVVLALEDGQLLRSANGGRHFATVAGAPADLVSIATDPFQGGRAVATDGTTVFESLDGGLSFRSHPFPAQQQTGTLRQLLFDPIEPGRLWLAAAARCAFCTGADQGVYLSDLYSFQWTKVLSDPTERVVADKGAFGHLFAIQDKKLLRTTDGGDTWQVVEVFDSALQDVWVDSAFAGHIVAAHLSGLSRSTDGGAIFQPVAIGLRTDAGDEKVEYVSRLLWNEGRLLAAVIGADHHLGSGLWVSGNLGGSFSLASKAFAAEDVADLDGFAGGQHQQIWAAGRDGIYVSGDGGVRYERSHPLEGLETAKAVLVDPYDPTGRTVYAAASRRAGVSDAFLWKTTDGGANWQELAGTSGGLPIEVGGLIATSHGGKKIYLTTIDGTLGGQYRGVLSSEDGGQVWKPLHLGVHVELLAKRPDDAALYAAGDALFRSIDGGETWQQRQTVLATAMTTFGNELFLAGPGLFHSSGDQGATLQSFELPPTIAEPASLLATADRIYLGDRAGGLFASVDRGRSWTALDLGLPEAPVTALYLAGGRLYAGTAGAGLYQAAALPAKAPLFFGGGRFTASIVWTDFLGQTGSGQAAVWTDDSGFFWFFDPNNVEVMVKLLDARSYNGHYWVFVGSLSNVEFTLTLRDEFTGAVRTYHNPLGSFASFGDLGAFVGESHISLAEGPPRAPVETKAAPVAAASTPVVTVGERFEISVDWEDGFGQFGQGLGRRVTGDTAAFTFFSPTNTELVIKVLDGRNINGHFWVFYGALTNVGYVITIKDLETGEQVLYHNPVGQFGSFGDITAF
jgi:photosystem II stability/assembly factor-like uncharacterized protein